MKNNISVALLISTYNWPEALKLLLNTVLNQTLLPDEILIGDDGSLKESKELVDRFRRTTKIPVKYAWHEDNGFRKSLIVNKIMKKATADYIIQVDGDILLHPRFIEDHVTNARANTFVQGSRVMVNHQTTLSLLASGTWRINFLSKGITNRINAIRSPLLSPLIRANPESSSNIKACNIAFWRNDYLSINGYDNEFNGWGWEDAEFAARLINAGIKKKRLKLAAICYHLHHIHNSTHHLVENELTYKTTILTKRVACSNGWAEVR